MAGEIKRLPDSELEIMQVIWDSEGPVRRQEIEEALRGVHEMAPTTVLTLLSRLEEKGFLRVRKEGRRSVYIPLIDREDYRAQQSRRFVDRMFGGSMQAFASALCGGGLSREELRELRKLLEEEGEDAR